MQQQELLLQASNRSGWRARIMSEQGMYLAHPDLSTPVYCGTGKHWCTFYMPVRYRGDQLSEEQRSSLYRYLLYLNDQMFLVKFALNARKDLFLCLEIPIDELQETLITHCLTGLKEYTQRYAPLINDFEHLPALQPLPSDQFISGHPPEIPADAVHLWLRSLNERNWYFSPKVKEQTWHLYFKRLFDVYFTTVSRWSYFQVAILKASPTVLASGNTALQLLFLEFLLRLNDDLYMAKFGLTSQNDVLLLLELPTELMNLSLFQLAIASLENYLNSYTQEIHLMSTLDSDPHFAKLLLRRPVAQ
ncbi:MAG TPA: hypothetical protein VL485_05260 [Ktedonobacteraceae bacterium]|jgi:hypothetical protein|nr:hypothetical protein [Ktedonobacteraceae bacterium]